MICVIVGVKSQSSSFTRLTERRSPIERGNSIERRIPTERRTPGIEGRPSDRFRWQSNRLTSILYQKIDRSFPLVHDERSTLPNHHPTPSSRITHTSPSRSLSRFITSLIDYISAVYLIRQLLQCPGTTKADAGASAKMRTATSSSC